MNLLNKRFKEKKPDSKWVPIKIRTWIPDVGDKIEGRLVKIIQNHSQLIYILQKDNGEKVHVWGKTYLNELMEEVNIDDYIRITYNGIKKTKNNRNMKKFNVERRIENEE